MTECCGKISMSILPYGWWARCRLAAATAAGRSSRAGGGALLQPGDVGPHTTAAQLMELVVSSGRPFVLMEVRGGGGRRGEGGGGCRESNWGVPS